MTVPIYLTTMRIALIPVMVLFFYLPFNVTRWLAAIVFALAAFTDWLDGFLARRWGQTTKLGEFLDPVADKLLVVVALVLIVGEKTLPYTSLPAAIIVGRELVISALREWMAELGKRSSIAVNFVGKFKTSLQMVAIFCLLWFDPDRTSWVAVLGYVGLYSAALMTVWSMCVYLMAAWSDLSQSTSMARVPHSTTTDIP